MLDYKEFLIEATKKSVKKSIKKEIKKPVEKEEKSKEPNTDTHIKITDEDGKVKWIPRAYKHSDLVKPKSEQDKKDIEKYHEYEKNNPMPLPRSEIGEPEPIQSHEHEKSIEHRKENIEHKKKFMNYLQKHFKKSKVINLNKNLKSERGFIKHDEERIKAAEKGLEDKKKEKNKSETKLKEQPKQDSSSLQSASISELTNLMHSKMETIKKLQQNLSTEKDAKNRESISNLLTQKKNQLRILNNLYTQKKSQKK